GLDGFGSRVRHCATPRPRSPREKARIRRNRDVTRAAKGTIAMDALPSIADLLGRVPSWVGRAVEWQRLEGGLSHHIYRVDVDGTSYVLRVLEPAVSAAGLGV